MEAAPAFCFQTLSSPYLCHGAVLADPESTIHSGASPRALMSLLPALFDHVPPALLSISRPAVQRAGEMEGTLREVGRTLDEALPVMPAVGTVLAGAVVLAVLLYLYRRYRRKKAEARFRPLFEAAPEAMLMLSERHRVVEANAAAVRLLQRPRRHVLGERLTDLTGAGQKQQQKLEAAFEALGGGEEEVAEEVQVEVSDEETIPVLMRLSALQIGGRRFYVAAFQDMTAASEQQALFKFFHRKTMESLPIGVAVLSREGTYLYANPEETSEEISRQWLRGKTDFDLCRRLGLHPEVALRRRSHRRRALQTGQRVRFEEVLPRRDAPPRHVERFYTPVRGDDGDEVYAVVTYGVDKTRFKQQEETLESAKQASKDFTQMKTQFMRNLRHEFRTPLTSILGAADVLKAEAPAAQQEFIEIIEQGGQRLMRTLDAMLDLTSLQGGGDVDQNPRVLDLAAAAQSVVGELEEPAARKDLFLRTQAPMGETLVRADPASLYRVLRSLLGNAVKFTREGGVVVEVSAEDGQAQVRVIDTGVGIAEEYLPHLFDAFGQESSDLSREFEGMGVGLAVARRIVDLMGGEIAVDSKKGEGSVFTVRLPEAFSGRTDAADAPSVPRVLLAEQKEEEQKLLHHCLSDFADLSVARSPAAALDAARGQPHEVVFVSAALSPDHAAADLLDAFRDVPGYEHVPIVVIDDNALPGAAQQFEAAGYDGYVARPLEREALLNALGDALSQSEETASPALRRRIAQAVA